MPEALAALHDRVVAYAKVVDGLQALGREELENLERVEAEH